jgi:hypothetical protein
MHRLYMSAGSLQVLAILHESNKQRAYHVLTCDPPALERDLSSSPSDIRTSKKALMIAPAIDFDGCATTPVRLTAAESAVSFLDTGLATTGPAVVLSTP